MESRAKLFGHPIHQMLIVFPLGLLAMALVFDIIHLVTAEGYWSEIAYWMIAAGLISGLIAAPFGLIDWLAIPAGTRAKRIGAWHGGGNLIVVLMYAGSWWLRRAAPQEPMNAGVSAVVWRRHHRAIHRLAWRRARRSTGHRGSIRVRT
jgi:uncharacterized membrane protein